ncbi:dipeptidyl aminopeptidase/acylaminoacyl peptidase [Psychromicrobium silvestre]|uniref:Dipeptidyl aminopeptidase/acylaminoacyl peptidase n=1 Tax=Psychromicrobium silvestre TaxID=1645614 RepID=A0A7Y9S6U8_9MICC|nr:dipeptidyl aminopeptidase/acylaminoacyl peptidase [Psychromicrobium silvestre]
MKPEHLPLIHLVSAPALHPTAEYAVISVNRPDFNADSYVGQLWEVPLEPGAKPRRITRGFRDSAPQFSPDGAALAFLRSAPGKAAQLHLVDARGGEPQAITDQKLGVGSFQWSPDSSRIVFTAAVPEEGRYGTLDGVGADAEAPRLITGVKYRMNGEGFTTDKTSQIFDVEVPALDAEPTVEPVGRAKGQSADSFSPVPQPRRLSESPFEHSAPRYSSNGERIYFIAQRLDSSDGCSELFSMSAEGGELQQLNNYPFSGFSISSATESADGKWLFALGEELGSTGTDFVAAQSGVFVRPVGSDESVSWRRLSDSENQDFGESPELVRSGPDAVLAFERARGRQRLHRFEASGETSLLVDEPLLVTAAATASGRTVLSYTDAQSFGDLALLSDAGLQKLTDFSFEFRAQAGVTALHEHSFPSSDGYPVHGWTLLPPGEGPHPVLLNIHGGPFAQYGCGIFDEAQVYVEAGYAVVMCNPRGAAGYGYQHARAIKHQMGTVDFADVLGFLEGALAEFPQLDGERLGIMGGSYGGYLTAWTISQDHRFTAAIVERGYLDPLSFVGSSDIGWIFPDEYNGSNPELIAAQSPMAQLSEVRTPALVVHSEEDWRCPIEQAQRYYVGLKRLGVETEMLIFPGENHELSRSGRPHHRKQRFEYILQWWAKYLPTAQNN